MSEVLDVDPLPPADSLAAKLVKTIGMKMIYRYRVRREETKAGSRLKVWWSRMGSRM